MKNGLLYSFGFIAILFILVKYIIPAIFKWQQNEHNHQIEIFNLSVQHEIFKSKEKTKIQKAGDFMSKMLAEIIPGLTSKMIGGV
ncbi:MAG: hypothetical protein RIA63_01240 [Cyclobacteriaceae bacterium]